MLPSPTPQELHPAFTTERLETLGGLLAETRDGAQRHAVPEVGDDPWVVGCTAFQRSCHAVRAATAKYDWLTVISDGRDFVFAVGGVPMRFFHGPPDAPPLRYRHTHFAERPELQLVFGFREGGEGMAFRVAVETTDDGLAEHVALVRVDFDGTVVGQWIIWKREGAAGAAETPAPVDLAPPSVQYGRKASGKQGAGSDEAQ